MKALKPSRWSEIPRHIPCEATVKCELCGKVLRVNVDHCMREGWPTCCEVGGSPQTMGLILNDKTADMVREASRTMGRTAPITGLMNWPLFYNRGLRRGLDIPRKNVKGVKA